MLNMPTRLTLSAYDPSSNTLQIILGIRELSKTDNLKRIILLEKQLRSIRIETTRNRSNHILQSKQLDRILPLDMNVTLLRVNLNPALSKTLQVLLDLTLGAYQYSNPVLGNLHVITERHDTQKSLAL